MLRLLAPRRALTKSTRRRVARDETGANYTTRASANTAGDVSPTRRFSSGAARVVSPVHTPGSDNPRGGGGGGGRDDRDKDDGAHGLRFTLEDGMYVYRINAV